jgi:hypothetical protein
LSSQRRQLSFVDGFGAGITTAALLPLLYFLATGQSFAAMYRDLASVELPLSTRIVLHPLWRLLVPALVIALGSWVLVRRPSYRYAIVVVAALAVLSVAATYVGAYRPIWMLAGNVD